MVTAWAGTGLGAGGRAGLRGWTLLGLATLAVAGGRIDPRLTTYREGLVVRGWSHGAIPVRATFYGLRPTRDRIFQFRHAWGALQRAGVGCLLWGGYRFFMLAGALTWIRGVGSARCVWLWVGHRPPLHVERGQTALQLAATPMLGAVPYAMPPLGLVSLLLLS